MRFHILVCGLIAGLCCFAGSSQADYYAPRVEALGNAVLVLEDETTALTIYNLGNPAGAAYLPGHNRVDFLGAYGQSNWDLEYVGNSVTANLTPGQVYSRNTKSMFASADLWRGTGYGGYLAWLTPETVLQFIPLADYQKTMFSDRGDAWRIAAGGTMRGAVRLTDALALGAGFTALPGQQEGPAGQFADALMNTPGAISQAVDRSLRLQAQLGANYRMTSVFDPQDRFDLAVLVNAASLSQQLEQEFPGLVAGTAIDQKITRYPWEAAFQAIYDYHGVLDAGLVLGYQRDRVLRSWDSEFFGDRAVFGSGDRENWDYEASLRVRLPMAREDDLRFGIVFNNRTAGHPYPTGRLNPVSEDAFEARPVIDTAASSIGIGMAVVPAEGSVIALEYRIGSAVSKQQNLTLADTGYTSFSFGVQYQVIEPLYARLGFTSEQIKFQFGERPNFTNRLTETDALRVGLGFASGPWRVDLTAIGSRNFHSPQGWTDVQNPTDEFEGRQDRTMAYTGLLGVSYVLGPQIVAGESAVSREGVATPAPITEED